MFGPAISWSRLPASGKKHSWSHQLDSGKPLAALHDLHEWHRMTPWLHGRLSKIFGTYSHDMSWHVMTKMTCYGQVVAVMTRCFGDGFWMTLGRFSFHFEAAISMAEAGFSASSWGYFTKFSIPEKEEAWDIRVLRYRAISVLGIHVICVSRMIDSYIAQSHDRVPAQRNGDLMALRALARLAMSGQQKRKRKNIWRNLCWIQFGC